MKIHPVGADFFDAERQPDMAKLILSLFCNFAGTPNDSHQYTDSNDHEPSESFDNKWDVWLIIRCMVTLTVWYVGNTSTVPTHSVAKF